jgi:hypothetical protein
VARDVVLVRLCLARELVVRVALDALLNDARRGAAGAADAIWSLLNLELWHRTFIDGAGVQTLPQPRASRQPTEHARPAPAAAESRGA